MAIGEKMTKADVLSFIKKNEYHIQIGKWNLSYLFSPCENSKYLIVCFGGNHHYGYIRSFYEEINKYNILYLMDDLSPDGKSIWWIGYDGDFSIGESYAELIKIYAQKSNIDLCNIYFVGNSLGAFGSLYISYMIGAGHVSAVSPYIAIGNVYPELPTRITGSSGIDLNEYIFKHFNRHTNVIVHILIANEDSMMGVSLIHSFIKILISNKVLFTIKNLKINHSKNIVAHSAIAYSICPEEILQEVKQIMERNCIY